MAIKKKIRVLIVDDSAIVRSILMDALSASPEIEVVGTAPDPFVARDKIILLEPDVLTLDIEMPRMDGLTFLRQIMKHRPMSVIIISSLAQESCKVTLEALRLGAVDALAKPSGPFSIGELRQTLVSKIVAAAAARTRVAAAEAVKPLGPKPPLESGLGARLERSSVIALGASTGGVNALEQVLLALPNDLPGIVITQHIPAGFSNAFAQRLNRICELTVKEAADGDLLQAGHVLIAPGDKHLILQRSAGGFTARVKDGPQVCYQRPSVDVLFHSVARAAGARAIGVLLTGMGTDGADGLLAMHTQGAHTIAQDEESCVVFGMPRAAIEKRAVDEVCPLDKVAGSICRALRAEVFR